MNNVKLYAQNNSLQTHEAQECLEMFSNKIQWKRKGLALDIGCGDGFVTTQILKTFLPQGTELVGCDKNEEMVKYARAKYSSAYATFIVQDIEKDFPQNMLRKFSYVFSFFVLHWTKKPDIAFKNMYDLMEKGGECLLMFLSQNSVYTAYRNLAQNIKWSPWMEDFEQHISQFHDKKEVEKDIQRMMYDVGFSYVDVVNKPKSYLFGTTESKIRAIRAVVSFRLPEDIKNEFIKDLSEEITRIDIMERHVEKTIAVRTLYYTLVYVHARK